MAVDAHLGWPARGVLKQGRSLSDANTDRLQYFLKRVGLTKKQLCVTAHGLRAGYCEERAISMGFIPATRGGVPGHVSKDSENLVRLKVAKEMGHSRISVTGAYYGSARSVKFPKQPRNQIGEAAAITEAGAGPVK